MSNTCALQIYSQYLRDLVGKSDLLFKRVFPALIVKLKY